MARHHPRALAVAAALLVVALGGCTDGRAEPAERTSDVPPLDVPSLDAAELFVSETQVRPWLRRYLARDDTAGATPSTLTPTTAVVADTHPDQQVRVEVDRLARRLPPCAGVDADGPSGSEPGDLLLPADAAVLDHGEATWTPRPGVTAVEQVTYYPSTRLARRALSQRDRALSCPDLDLRPVPGRTRLPQGLFGFALHVQQAEGLREGRRVRVVDVWGAHENALAVARVVVDGFTGPRGDALGDGVGPRPPGSASRALGGRGDPDGGPVDAELLRDVRRTALAGMQTIDLMSAPLLPGE